MWIAIRKWQIMSSLAQRIETFILMCDLTFLFTISKWSSTDPAFPYWLSRLCVCTDARVRKGRVEHSHTLLSHPWLWTLTHKFELRFWKLPLTFSPSVKHPITLNLTQFYYLLLWSLHHCCHVSHYLKKKSFYPRNTLATSPFLLIYPLQSRLCATLAARCSWKLNVKAQVEACSQNSPVACQTVPGTAGQLTANAPLAV